MSFLNTYQQQVVEYGGGGGGITQSILNITTPTSSVIFDIPPNTKAINISSLNLAVSALDSVMVQLGNNVSFTTSGYTDLGGSIFPNGFNLTTNTANPQTQLMPLIVSDKKYTGIVLTRTSQGVQSIELPYVATRLRFICLGGATINSGNITVNFSQ
jgi:hypothetical protein